MLEDRLQKSRQDKWWRYWKVGSCVCWIISPVLNLSQFTLTHWLSLSLIDMYTRTNVRPALPPTTLNQPTWGPHSNPSRHSCRAVSRSYVLHSKENKVKAKPEAPPKQWTVPRAAQIHSTVPRACTKLLRHNHPLTRYLFLLLLRNQELSIVVVVSSIHCCVVHSLLIDAAYLQPSHPAGMNLQSAVPRPPDILDLDLDLDLKHYLLAIYRISWFCSHWPGQSAISEL